MGMDNAHLIPLGDDRFLWIFQDAFLDPDDTRNYISQNSTYLHNVALLQDGNCFGLLHRGTAAAPLAFESGDVEPDTGARFFWPLGGSSAGGLVKIFWAEMQHDPRTPRDTGGILRHPVRTWLAEYDVTTLRRLSIAPAWNDRVTPQWGFAVESNESYSYLFGNSNMLNYWLVGGWFNGPHTATRMYLARVPRDRLARRPEYRTADGWSDDPAAAVPISERFWSENQMQPRLIDGQWVSVTKVDGFAGSELVVDVADEPWGPWTTVQRSPIDPQTTAVETVTYHAMLLPWRDPSGDLIVVLSRNAKVWDVAVNGDPALYRSIVMRVPFPAPEQRVAEAPQATALPATGAAAPVTGAATTGPPPPAPSVSTTSPPTSPPAQTTSTPSSAPTQTEPVTSATG